MIPSAAQSLQYRGQRLISDQTNNAVLADSSTVSTGSISAGTASSNGGAHNPLQPKFRSLTDLERNVDRSQAESLKMIRLGHRPGHHILTNPQDYFYRNLLLPAVGASFLQQLWTSLFLVIFWTAVAGFFDMIFTHCFMRTEKRFLQNLTELFRSSAIFRPWTILGAVLIAAASSWNYLQLVRIPPPLFASRTRKLIEFLRTLAVNGPCALVCASIVCLRPSYHVQLSPRETPVSNQISDATELASSGTGLVFVQESADLNEFMMWEIGLKIIMPALYMMAIFIAGNFVHFWLGDCAIGLIKTSPHGPSLSTVQHPLVFLKLLLLKVTSTVSHAVQPILLFPGRKFWLFVSALFGLSAFFPVASLFRVWMQYHFLAFAVLHAWKLNLLGMRVGLARMHGFRELEFSDWINLPPVLAGLRKSGWWWSEYLEMQLRAVFLDQLKMQPNFLAGFLRMRIPTNELNHLDEFVKFWLQPIQDFSRQFHALQFLGDVEVDPRSRRLDFLLWIARQLHCLHDHYVPSSNENLLDQDFTAYPLAAMTKPSVRTIEHVRCVCLFAIRAKAMDTRNILSSNYSKILEQMAALSVILGKSGEKFEDLVDGRLFARYPNMEPCIRFYIKSYRQLERLTQLNATELVSALAKDMSELHFKEYPELMPYVDSLFQQTKGRE